MADYPLGMDGQGKPGGRIRVLQDNDGDGRYDDSPSIRGGIELSNGIITLPDGVLITAAPHILFFAIPMAMAEPIRRKCFSKAFSKAISNCV